MRIGYFLCSEEHGPQALVDQARRAEAAGFHAPVRIHPAVVAPAAATSAVLLEGRFALGVGSGEALNEHILGP